MENISYGELALCQAIAGTAAIQYRKQHGEYPQFADDAQNAVIEWWQSGHEQFYVTLEWVNQYIELIINQIGLMVEEDNY